MKEHFLWVEKYRSDKIDDCILSPELRKLFNSIKQDGNIPNMLLVGGPGQGKTTVTLALCKELDYDYLFINGSDERGIDTLRNKIKVFATSRSFEGKKKLVVVDEADYLTGEAQAAFRGVIEECAKFCTFVFTANYKNKIIEALQSRCQTVEFKHTKEIKKDLIEQVYKRLTYILKQENIEVTSPKVLGHLIVRFFPDIRKCIGEVQKYSRISSKIDEGILSVIKDSNISVLINLLKEKNVDKTREWVGQNIDSEPHLILSNIYSSLKSTMQTVSIPQAILHIGEWQQKVLQNPDPEIPIMCCLINLMEDCKWQ